MFTRIEFTNFKGFEKLELDGLKRVNLVVGKNNSGKTSLLEGIAIVADPKRANELPNLLREGFGDPNKRFYSRLIRDNATIASLVAGKRQVKLSKELPDENETELLTFSNLFVTGKREPKVSFTAIPAGNIAHDKLINAFGVAILQKGGEEQLEQALRTIDNRIAKIRVDPASDGNILVVDIGLNELIPLEQVGQGVNRLVVIFSGLIGEKANICFIDEIENGIHHSAMEDIWKGIGEIAEKTGVQVFATTHSYGCIESAHAAFSKRANYDFSIIQLFRVQNGVQGRVLDQKHIEAAIAGDIDLRGV